MQRDEVRTAADLFEWALEENPRSMTEAQIKFARYLFDGDPQIEAARKAGYTGTLGPTASRLKRNAKVRWLLEEAAGIDDADKNAHALPDEILRILTDQARHGDNSQARIRAAEALNRHYAALGEAQRPALDYPELLTQMCEIGSDFLGPPFLSAAAFCEAALNEVEWRPAPKHVERLRSYPALVSLIRETIGDDRYLKHSARDADSAGKGAANGLNGNGDRPSLEADDFSTAFDDADPA